MQEWPFDHLIVAGYVRVFVHMACAAINSIYMYVRLGSWLDEKRRYTLKKKHSVAAKHRGKHPFRSAIVVIDKIAVENALPTSQSHQLVSESTV